MSSRISCLEVILAGDLLGMSVAVKLPLANASLSLPDLANELLGGESPGPSSCRERHPVANNCEITMLGVSRFLVAFGGFVLQV